MSVKPALASGHDKVRLPPATIAYTSPVNFPPLTGPGAWPWDISPLTVTNLLSLGFQRNILFCPSFANQNQEQYWNFAVVHGGDLRVLRQQ